MKRYIIALLLTVILVLSSLLYRESRRRVLADFPIPTETRGEPKKTPVMYLFMLFNSKNCRDCMNVVDVLNKLPEQYKVMGLVPLRDYRDQERIREISGAKFELQCYDPFKRYMPHYAPTLYGINRNGKILFVLPGVPGESNYLAAFLDTFYRRAYQLLIDRTSLDN